MNLYVRYFDHDTLATNMDEVAAFLNSLHDVKVNDDMFGRIASFIQSDSAYPFRLKVSYSNYILFLKTDAKDLAEFKYREKMRKQQQAENHMTMAEKKRNQLQILSQEHVGWYEASMLFKRVIMDPETGKCQYCDTVFRVKLTAQSPMDCYNRILQHLKNRQDVDPRSQFPSVKSNNFQYQFLSENLDDNDAEEGEENEAANSSDSHPEETAAGPAIGQDESRDEVASSYEDAPADPELDFAQ